MCMDNNGTQNQKSTATEPDLDWSQIQETVMMLNLAVAQIDRAMNEGGDSISTLTHSFTSMAGSASIIAEACSELPNSTEKTAILKNSQAVSAQMQSAIMAFQFYDKLSQRLNHVCNSLASLSRLIGDPDRLFSPYEWRGLQQKIRSKYPTEADKLMFDALLNGATVEEALNMTTTESPAETEDIELF